jgi:hypothetical protein
MIPLAFERVIREDGLHLQVVTISQIIVHTPETSLSMEVPSGCAQYRLSTVHCSEKRGIPSLKTRSTQRVLFYHASDLVPSSA